MRFLSDKSGNVAMMFALALLPMMIFAGFAVEFNRHQNVERETQAALDITALAVAKERQGGINSLNELRLIAQATFDGNFTLDATTDMRSVDLQVVNDEIIVSVEGAMPTFLLSVIGQDELGVQVESGAIAGEPVAVEVALVLDISNSMSGTRIDGLRTASKALVEELIDPSNEDIRIGIVPFNDYVNVGLSNRDESWIDVPGETSGTYESCPIDREAAEDAGCTFETVCRQEGQFGSGSEGCRQERTCPVGYEVERQECTERTWEREWLGCVNSRAEPLNINDGSFGSSPALGALMGSGQACYSENEIVELSNEKSLLRRKIDDLRAGGSTYMAPGLAWSLRVLSDEEPFTDARLSGVEGRQTVILLSDGANTVSRSANGEHRSSDSVEANNDTLAACTLIKDGGIDIYTIDYGVDDAVTEQLLKDCSSGEEYNFEADSSNQLLQVFQDIATRFNSLSLSR